MLPAGLISSLLPYPSIPLSPPTPLFLPPPYVPSLPPIQVNSLQKKASDIHDLLTRMSFQAEQVVAGKLTNQSYAKDDDSNRKRLNQLMNEAETLVQSL